MLSSSFATFLFQKHPNNAVEVQWQVKYNVYTCANTKQKFRNWLQAKQTLAVIVDNVVAVVVIVFVVTGEPLKKSSSYFR